MSILTNAIRACLGPVTTGENGSLRAEALFPPDFPGFSGHFPGNPVLPGVCLVQAALVVLSIDRKTTVRLKRLVTAKWPASVLPGETVRIILMPGAAAVVKALVTRGADRVAEFSMEIVTSAGSSG